jgi:5-formyltetrahydrofolate cyclo-ligase
MHQTPTRNYPSKQLRQELRCKRSELSTEVRNTFDQAICEQLWQQVKNSNARSIACYWPFNGEPDLIPLCRRLIDINCEIALPVISADTAAVMKFCRWRAEMKLVKNRFGISEPPEGPELYISDFDMLIMPLVAYDRFGNRLGMGAGFYDRHLQLLRESKSPLRVGAAYSLQKIDPINTNHWDIPLHAVVNERGWFTFVE